MRSIIEQMIDLEPLGKSGMCDDRRPALLFSRESIVSNCEFIYRTACSALSNVVPFFAVKVAPDARIVAAVRGASSCWGAEVYNEVDLGLAIEAGFDHIVADGYFKSPQFIESCVAHHVTSIHVDSVEEAFLINNLCKSMDVKVGIGLRCKTDNDSKMGISQRELAGAVLDMLKLSHVTIKGVHTHPGSNSQGKENAYAAYRYQAECARILQDAGARLDYVDIGGGVGEVSAHGARLKSHYDKVREIFAGVNVDRVFIEPGRGVVGDAGALICHVVSVDHVDRIVNVDIAVYPFIATTGATFKYAFPDSVAEQSDGLAYAVGGIWPTSSDVILPDRLYDKIPCNVKPGDRFVLYNAGAYTLDRLAEYSFGTIPVAFV